jgi:cyclic-di-GMP phosphodiesterase, flagellum assembly factor TipF
MVRLGAIFVAACMVLIAGSIGTVLNLSFGLGRMEAAVVAIAALTGLALFNAVTTRANDRADFSDQIADLSRGTADLARQVGEVGRRLAAAEAEVAKTGDRAHAVTRPLAAEIELLATLVNRLADSVEAHESALVGMAGGSRPPAASERAVADRAAPVAEPIAPREAAGASEPAVAAGHFAGVGKSEVAAIIRQAVEANRADLYLQPIVALPQRKVRYYEATTRLRTEGGELIEPADFLGPAESGGLMPRIDNLLLFRCVQVVRRLMAKNREIGVFCNIAADTLTDAEFFPQMAEFMQANRALGGALVLEFAQKTVRAMGPIEMESLAALAELGFRFSMDRVIDLRLEPRDLAERGFRFVKVPAPLLLNRAGAGGSDIHPADFSDLLGRFGIDLIAERIESEGTVVDLLDFDVRFGQGSLFSPPRPVRSEVLQGIADRTSPTPRHEPVLQPDSPRVPAAAARTPVSSPAAAEPRPAARAGAMAQLARNVVRRA